MFHASSMKFTMFVLDEIRNISIASEASTIDSKAKKKQ